MVSADERKRDIVSNINQNPVKIVIKEKRREVVDGALEMIDFSHEATVRIYPQSYGSTSDGAREVKGSYSLSKKYGMLADSSLDIEALSERDLSLETPHGNLKVISYYPQVCQGEICGYQCDLERID